MRKLGKKIVLLCSVSLCALAIFAGNNMQAYASEEVITLETNVGARSTNLEWFYKYIDGVEYMRLWNHSTGQWITDWIPVP